MRVVLLHGGIGAVQEQPVEAIQLVPIQPLLSFQAEVNSPCRSALLRGLAKKEPQLLKTLCENVLRGHGGDRSVYRQRRNDRNSTVRQPRQSMPVN